MRVRPYSRILRLVSCGTLFFFCWVYLSLFEIPAAYAAEKAGGAKAQKSAQTRNEEQKPQTAGEKFEKNLESIHEQINRAGERSRKGEEPKAEIESIKAKKAEIESIDAELKAEFSVTEKKLKDAHLPSEILDRHHKFVKHYQDNLKELIANLEGVERATTKAQVDATVKKTKSHLDKVKSPRRHKALDPNKLPHRLVKAKEKAPRLKKEDFERDFPKRKSQSKKKLADSRLLPDLLAGRAQQKPVLLAFNETVSDIPFSFWTKASPGFNRTGAGLLPSNATLGRGSLQIDSSPYLLAQATDQPSADDLAETPEVQFTDAIRAKAVELGNSPLKIYEWVRNNIEFAPTYGSIQGADQCLQSKICNDIDTASLLISLLRVSGIYSHYEYSTIEIPIEKAMNWVGGVTDPKMAGTILATNGIPAKVLVSGGTIKAVQLEHVYVKAWIDYIPSRGAVQRQGDTWIPLDPSYKQYTYTQGIDIQSAVPVDAQTFVNQILSTATTNTTEGYVTNVNSALVQQTMQSYQTQVQNYITQNHPNATVGDVIGKKEIKAQVLGILPVTLPYKIVQNGAEFAQVPENLRATMSFSIPDQTGMDTGLSYSTSLPKIAGKKITLSFSPATVNDQKVIESLLPKPHADGTPIQPSELPLSFPAYLINLKPELRIDGQVVATGALVTMGSAQSFTMSLNEPGIGVSNIDNTVQAGEYFGIGVDIGRIGADRLQALKKKIDSTRVKLDTQSYDGISGDDLIGDLLYTTIADYFAELDMTDEIAARNMGIIRYRAPSVGMFSLSFAVNEVFGFPQNARSDGMRMDVDRIMQAVFSKNGDIDNTKRFMLASGDMSSTLEYAVPEKLFSTPGNTTKGISAIKALQIANDQGIPIYLIDQTNINTILLQLQLDSGTKTDIQNAVNAGKEVMVSKTEINFNGWTGCGYIIIDPSSGAGAYMISGGSNGGYLKIAMVAMVMHYLAIAMAAEETELQVLDLSMNTLGAIVGPVYASVSTTATQQDITVMMGYNLGTLYTSFGIQVVNNFISTYSVYNIITEPNPAELEVVHFVVHMVHWALELLHEHN